MARKKLYYYKDDIVSGYKYGLTYMYDNNVEYIGPYHTYKSTGEVYTENYYIENVSLKLYPYVNFNKNDSLYNNPIYSNDRINIEYNQLKNNTSENKFKYNEALTPKQHTPIIQSADYEVGYIIRYVVCQKNSKKNIYEVSKENFNQLDSTFFIKKEFRWGIYHPNQSLDKKNMVIENNKKTVKLLEGYIPHIRLLNTLIDPSYLS